MQFAAPTRRSWGFAVRAFGCTLELTASCDAGRQALERWVFPALARREGGRGRADVWIDVAEAREGCEIRADGLVVGTGIPEAQLGLEVVRALDDALIPRLKSLCAVHAGAVSWKGRALLLPGRSHAGKSSLVAELVRRGAAYFSDEYALIDDTGRVHAYPRPLLMRSGSPEQVPVRAEEYGSATAAEPARVGWILALEYGATARWGVETMAQSEALMMLLRNTPQLLSERPEMVRTFGRVVAGAVCRGGRRNEAGEAAEEILLLMEGLPRRRGAEGS